MEIDFTRLATSWPLPRNCTAIGRIFSPPAFDLIPVDENTWPPTEITLAWAADRMRHPAQIESLLDRIAAAVAPVRHGSG